MGYQMWYACFNSRIFSKAIEMTRNWYCHENAVIDNGITNYSSYYCFKITFEGNDSQETL